MHGACKNGSKLFYGRRISGSHCLNDESQAHMEPCICSLSDFECLPSYKRLKDGICLPRSRYIFAQDCACNENSSLITRSRGYVKSKYSQCTNGVEKHLSDAYVTHRDPNQPSIFLLGIDSLTKHPIVEIHTSDFDQNDDTEDDEDEDEHYRPNKTWLIDETYDVTALVFDENGKQVYMAVEHDQSAVIHRIRVNENYFTKYFIVFFFFDRKI